MNVPPLTWLYVPADRPDRVEKAIASKAHAVIVDLEDGVAPGAKAEALANLGALLGRRHEKPVFVRFNAGEPADLEAVAGLEIAGVIVPKVGSPEDVPALAHPIHCLIESAAGVEAAAAEVERACATIERLEAAGAGTLRSGEFVDAAMLGSAQQLVALSDAYGVSPTA